MPQGHRLRRSACSAQPRSPSKRSTSGLRSSRNPRLCSTDDQKGWGPELTMSTATKDSKPHAAIIAPEARVCEQLARAGVAAGYAVSFPSDPEAWALGHNGVVLIAIETKTELETVDKLFKANPQLVLVALLEGTAHDLGPAALRRGATVVMDRSSHPRDVLTAVHLALQGRVVLPSRLLTELIGSDEFVLALDEAELMLLQELADGATVQRMARHRYQATRTVERSLRRLYLRIGADSRMQAVAKASQMGLVKVT